jgi:predicted 3-demethylubiquinone-9 3-methyltransferase (glyoxalase superfamily)
MKEAPPMPKIMPFLWFDGRLEEAVGFYTGAFRSAHVETINELTATFVIEGQSFMALNGGPGHVFNDAVSFFIRCETQDEVDEYWQKLTSDGGSEGRCGWLKDKFGLSWQVVPNALGRYMADADRVKANRVIQAMLKMNKIDIAALDAAYIG